MPQPHLRGCNLQVWLFFGKCPHVDGISSTCRTPSLRFRSAQRS